MSKHSLLLTMLITCTALFCSASPASAQPWRVGTWKTAQTYQPYFYEQFSEGQEVRVFPFTNPADQKAALLAGSLDMTGTTLAHAIASASRGEPIVIVAALCNKSSALVVGKDSSVQEVRDLKGLRIGYVPGTMHEILLREVLARNGLDSRRDVSLVRVDFFDMGLALARNDIDAFLSGEPFPSLAVHQGYGRILAHPYFDDSIGPINAAMIVARRTVEQRPDLVQRMVDVHVRATKHLLDNEEEWLQAAADFGTPLEVLRLAAENIELAWEMNETFIRQVAALGRRMLELGLIEREPDYDRLIDPRFVARFAAE
ncbi:NitT/TauT family transport system substrate-binding protein [Desulfonatronum thiosulfatophilum]|uniref:NitT/TauT family transport system substrate-binding protein n=1 Tax=Desulfonatronum thiosulfatophilum TaxID=617002 RepID=A0A1G6AKL5_9BACT|nr:NrtA/SsuA/CpmA family ABC transporter substrate-binding protein [Desulfonatronum thiosulfatophilum]SDB08978.1 NitT/TauT family transport system substrate-binding protein [Desulfonatronum thiosulfatophilum]